MSEFFMGCDVSKGYADFVIIGCGEEVIEPTFQVDDTAEGHAVVVEFLSTFFKKHTHGKLYVGVESTGGYENNWIGLFSRMAEIWDIKATRLNPLPVKAHHEAAMRRIGTDDISALNIASYLIAYRSKVNYEQDNSFSSLRKQWNFTELLKKQKTQLSNQLGFLIYQSHPELVRYCKDGIPRWILLLLKRYPTAARLTRAKASSVAKIPFISPSRAASLIEEAMDSVAASTDETDGFVIKETVQQIMTKNIAIEAQKERMEASCAIPETKLLTTIPGVGIYSAIGLIINIVSVARFANVKKLASYFGLHPVYRQSGDGIWGFHMSKKGRVEPRAILYMTVLSALNCNPLIRELYDRCVAGGMNRMEAIGVCMHKMLRIVYGMLRNGAEFEPAVDEKNRKRRLLPGSPNRHHEKKRRMQPHDKRAPISKRQSKRRKGIKQEAEPQKDTVPKNGVIPNLLNGKNNKSSKIPSTSVTMPTVIGKVIEKEMEKLGISIYT